MINSTGAGWSAAAIVLALAIAALGSACTDGLPFGSDDDERYLTAGRALIEGDLATRIGLGPLEASCEGSGLGAGSTFACSGRPDGRPAIEFVATISDDGEGVDLASTNLLLADQVERIEAFAASLIAAETGQPIGPEHFECADSSLVVRAGQAVDCLVTDPLDEMVHAVTVTVDDLDTLSVTVDVGDPVG